MKKTILVTCALPYANGSLHIGHMLEYIQADIWVRFQRMQQNDVYFICADDAHGTPIMLKAQQLNIDPEKMIKNIQKEHYRDCCKFSISYDNYYSTHSEENKELLNSIFLKLKNQGLIKSKFISQLYDIQKKIFLPDRFIQGTCPKCQAPEQYGDNCDQCGAIYTPLDLINPKSIISGSLPIIKKSKHFFFNLPFFTKQLYSWIHSGVMQTEIVNKTEEWFKSGLQNWDISRDAPYFGFKIPNTSSKYFYVWMDATIGYLSTFKNLCKKNNKIRFEDFWELDSKTELYHFIGKDITYFHSLFWPAILEGSQLRKPTAIFVHGHVTLNGSKISKSKGTVIKVSTYLSHLHSDYLRYYYATKLSSKVVDIDLNFNDFSAKVNADIINKVLNLAARSSKFINQYNNGQLSNILEHPDLYMFFIKHGEIIAKLFHCREFSDAIRNTMKLADAANRYIDQRAPWNIFNNTKNLKHSLVVFSMGIQLFRILMIYLKPVVPILAKYSEDFLNTNLIWIDPITPLINHRINKFEIIFCRINPNQIQAITQASNKNISNSFL